jgi:hypothetical protein
MDANQTKLELSMELAEELNLDGENGRAFAVADEEDDALLAALAVAPT